MHAVRKVSGKKLAQESPAQADMVIGVPNSSLSAASGYAEEIQLPYEMGLVKPICRTNFYSTYTRIT